MYYPATNSFSSPNLAHKDRMLSACAKPTQTHADLQWLDKGFICSTSYRQMRAHLWAPGQLATGQLWLEGAMTGFVQEALLRTRHHVDKTLQLSDWNLLILRWLEGKKEPSNGLTRRLCQRAGRDNMAVHHWSLGATCLEGKNWGEGSALLQAVKGYEYIHVHALYVRSTRSLPIAPFLALGDGTASPADVCSPTSIKVKRSHVYLCANSLMFPKALLPCVTAPSTATRDSGAGAYWSRITWERLSTIHTG